MCAARPCFSLFKLIPRCHVYLLQFSLDGWFLLGILLGIFPRIVTLVSPLFAPHGSKDLVAFDPAR